MVNTFIGNLGHYFVIIAFVLSLVSTFSYWYASSRKDDKELRSWKKLARVSFIGHGLAVFGIVITLFYIIHGHYYEYHYAWSHSSNNLPTHYMISCFWEGQEGSFLLWIFWHVLIGFALLKAAKKWEIEVMPVFTLVQAFLVSMILGVVVLNLKIGSSPFALLRDVIDAPIFKTNPDFIPKDGTGLNPLLQNYWMVIHPPTLFLGFALTLIPFAFCIAGLKTKLYKDWVQPALPWAQVAAAILGIGIMMGAYWAYETLNFGGYWNWDPVENAVYIPWLVLVAAIHVMITFKSKGSALIASMILVIASFILVLYATFLTRSGVLGEASVHSFTDLGLSGQLLIYLFAFIGISVYLLVRSWKELPSTDEEISTYSREFWIFLGATTLCLSAFQVLNPTSYPVYNALLGFFGIESNLAPPADQVVYYTKFQIWFGVVIALLSGTGQFFWWKKMDKDKLKSAITIPLILTLLFSSVIILLAKVHQPVYILLLTACIYSIVANGSILIKLLKTNVNLAGGAITHMGVAMMLLGILFSSGYSKVISLNTTGLLYNREFPEEMNKENLLLFRNQPQKMLDYSTIGRDGVITKSNAEEYGYSLVYKGPRVESEDFPDFINKDEVIPTHDPFKAITKEDLVYKGKTYAKKGDTIQVYGENTYYEIEYTTSNGDVFNLFPRIQNNPQMGTVVSPDIRTFWGSDLYTHLTNMPDPDAANKWTEPENHLLSIGDTFFVNDYVARLENVVRVDDVVGADLGEGDVAVKANIRLYGLEKEYEASPIYMIKDRQVGMQADVLPDLGVKIKMEKIDPNTGTFTFTSQTTQKDWVILKVIEKPFINILWIGTIVMSLGFVIAINRRFREYSKTGGKSLRKSNKGGKKKTPKMA
ncbi:heme lyase CcmF/NrfE family subunit [Flexithrix dorotheae]|uniref:heme lyase CcmF/NrfE family subunit n=1 Tax=Flexithrix dorotheae TaxID=70993 RepID=UPI0005C49F00|nr:cytochrome c biogenesis protein CcsA [Flexithrix dorotheae]